MPSSSLSLRVTVVMPVYNSASTISAAVWSVLEQTHSNLEIIVVDDGSTDETLKAIAAIPDQRIRVIPLGDNRGPSAARNEGIAAASGDLIAFLDADDLWLPEKLAMQVDLFARNPVLGLAYCGAHEVTSDLRCLRTPGLGNPWPPPGEEAFRRIVLREHFIVAPLSSMIIRKACLDEVGYFDEKIVQAEEWDLAFRLVDRWIFDFVPQPLVLYRMTGHFNPQKRLARHIGDAHLTTLERAFKRIGNPPHLESLRIAALAETHWLVALYYYAVRQPELAEMELTKLAALSPRFLDLKENDRGSNTMAFVACGLYDTVTPLRDALAFIDYSFDHFPPSVQFDHFTRRRTKAFACATTAFDSYPRRERRRVWSGMFAALALQPSLVSNRGLLKLPFLTMVGDRARSVDLVP